ncbi:Transmembrane protein [Parasponia andersonii]|uniref:Transmembrane protein n=1 Tax=Parasponia andersonii TaxID=3476 RepID=A0A2P5CDB4_PARAD|nr:Transmembrane protein [Parasponia andersonii]
MCGGPEQFNSKTRQESESESESFNSKTRQESESESESESDAKAMNNPNETDVLLELAADDDVERFKQCINDGCLINEAGLWYCRQRAAKRMAFMGRTPLMVAAMNGSLEVVKLILSMPQADINRSCDPDKSTALHCAASSGTISAIEVVKLLLLAGADINATDCNGHRPFDVIVSPPNLANLKVALAEVLKSDGSACQSSSIPRSPSLQSSPEKGSSSSLFDSTTLPPTYEPNDLHISPASKKKQYPIDPSIPDIKNSIYSTDEFRMFSFKIRPCSRTYSHDWKECPFVHPGENARRRDPKKFHYSCVPCPDHRKAKCRRGDSCEYAHGVFESLLHPAQYRTQICKDSTSCPRRVCFFAHTTEELRPLYQSTGSAVPSHRSATSAATAIDIAPALNLLPGSPSVPILMPPSNGISKASMPWPQQKIPTLQLPGSHLQMSRLRSFNARNVPVESFQLQQKRPSMPSDLNELFSSKVISPRYSLFSPSQNPALFNKLQLQDSMLSPVKTNSFSPTNFEHASLGDFLPGMMSSQGIEHQFPFSSGVYALGKSENQQQQLRSFGSRDLGSRSLPFHDTRVLDLSLVQSLVKQSPSDINETTRFSVSDATHSGEYSNLRPLDQTGSEF